MERKDEQITNASKGIDSVFSEETSAIKQESPADFETAIAATGFGTFNIILLLLAVPAAAGSMFDTTSMSYILPAAQCDLKLTLADKGMLNAITYMGMITSAFVWGFLADTLGRKKLIIIGFSMDAFFVVLCGLAQNYTVLVFSKYMTGFSNIGDEINMGFSINGPFAVLATYMSEMHATKYRTKAILCWGIMLTNATVILPLLAWLILPQDVNVQMFGGKFVLHSWNFYLLICALPSTIAAIGFWHMPESPKFLMTVGQNKKALEILRKIYSINTGRPPELYGVKELIDEVAFREEHPSKHGGHITANRTTVQALKEGWQQILPLIFPPHLYTFVVICTTQLTAFMGMNTFRLWLPQLFTAISDYGIHHQNGEASFCDMLDFMKPNGSIAKSNQSSICTPAHMDHSVYVNTVIVAGTSIVTYVIILTIVHLVKRKAILITLAVCAGISGLSMYFARNSSTITVLSTIYISAVNVFPNIIIGLVVDIFPTSLRAMALSLTMMAARSAAVVGNLIFPSLLDSGCLPPFILIGGILLVCSIVSCFLPNIGMKSLE